MTKPHRYIKNQFVCLSRETHFGLPLLMPNLASDIKAIFVRDALRFNIVILALNVSPFGYEVIVFDADMRRSDFIKSVNQCISMKVKKNIEHRESVWTNRKPGNVLILDLAILQQELLRVTTTPVREGYVREISDWELPNFGPQDWLEEPQGEDEPLEQFRLDRSSKQKSIGPPLFNRGVLLEKILAGKSDLVERVRFIEEKEKKRRKNVLGKEQCRKKSTFESLTAPILERGPMLASNSARVRKLIESMKLFYRMYRDALSCFIQKTSVEFPSGVLKMRKLFGVKIAAMVDDELFSFDFLE